MLDVPLNTHRRLIEPLSECNHVKKVHVKRFIGFLGQIEKCPKVVVSQLLIHVKQDVRSNSKKIMLLSGKTRVEEVDQSDATKLKYHQLNDDEEWKVVTNKELIDVKYGRKELENLNYHEIKLTIDRLPISPDREVYFVFCKKLASQNSVLDSKPKTQHQLNSG